MALNEGKEFLPQLTDEVKVLIDSFMKGCFDVATKMGLSNCLAKELLDLAARLEYLPSILKPIEQFLLSDDMQKLNEKCRKLSRCWEDTFNSCVVAINQCVRKIIQDGTLKDNLKHQLIKQANEELRCEQLLTAGLKEEMDISDTSYMGWTIFCEKHLLSFNESHLKKALIYYLKWKKVIEPLFTVEIPEDTGIEIIPGQSLEMSDNLLEQPFDNSDSELMDEEKQNENVSNSLTEMSVQLNRRNDVKYFETNLTKMLRNSVYSELLEDVFVCHYSFFSEFHNLTYLSASTDVSVTNHRSECSTNTYGIPSNDVFLEDCFASLDINDPSTESQSDCSSKMSADSILNDFLTRMSELPDFKNILNFLEKLFDNSDFKKILNFLIEFPGISHSNHIMKFLMDIPDDPDLKCVVHSLNEISQTPCFEKLLNSLVESCDDSDFKKLFSSFMKISEYTHFRNILNFLKNLVDSDFGHVLAEPGYAVFYKDQFKAIRNLCADSELNNTLCFLKESFDTSDFKDVLSSLKIKSGDSDFNNLLSGLKRMSERYNEFSFVLKHAEFFYRLKNLSEKNSDLKDLLDSLKKFCHDKEFRSILLLLKVMLGDASLNKMFSLSNAVLEARDSQRTLKDASSLNKLNTTFFHVTGYCAELTVSAMSAIQETLRDQAFIEKIQNVAYLSRKLSDMVQDIEKSSSIARELQELNKVRNLMEYLIHPALCCLRSHSTEKSFSWKNFASIDCKTVEEMIETICCINTKLLQDMLNEHINGLLRDAEDIKDSLLLMVAIVEDENSIALQLILNLLDNIEITKKLYSIDSMKQEISSFLKEIKYVLLYNENNSTLGRFCQHNSSASCLLNFFFHKFLCFNLLSNDVLCDFQLNEDCKLHVSNALTIHSSALAQLTVSEQIQLVELTKSLKKFSSEPLKEFRKHPVMKKYKIKLDMEICAEAEFLKNIYGVDNVNDIKIGESISFGELKPHQVCRLANVLKNSLNVTESDGKTVRETGHSLMNLVAKLAIDQGAKNLTEYIAIAEFVAIRMNEETRKQMKIQPNKAKKEVKEHVTEDLLNNMKELSQEFSHLLEEVDPYVDEVIGYPKFLNRMSLSYHYYKHRKLPKVNPERDLSPKEYMDLAISTVMRDQLIDMMWTQDGGLILYTFICKKFGIECNVFEIWEKGKVGISTLMPEKKKQRQKQEPVNQL